MALMRFLVTTSVKRLLLCITQYLVSTYFILNNTQIITVYIHKSVDNIKDKNESKAYLVLLPITMYLFALAEVEY